MVREPAGAARRSAAGRTQQPGRQERQKAGLNRSIPVPAEPSSVASSPDALASSWPRNPRSQASA